MEAELLFKRKFEVTTKVGKPVVVFMDLYRLPLDARAEYPERYKFSWIAFDPENEEKRVLFDCHGTKGPHSHVDNDKDGVPFEWLGLDSAVELFFAKVKDHFGDFEDLEE